MVILVERNLLADIAGFQLDIEDEICLNKGGYMETQTVLNASFRLKDLIADGWTDRLINTDRFVTKNTHYPSPSFILVGHLVSGLRSRSLRSFPPRLR